MLEDWYWWWSATYQSIRSTAIKMLPMNICITPFFQEYSILGGQHFKSVTWVWYRHWLVQEKEGYFIWIFRINSIIWEILSLLYQILPSWGLDSSYFLWWTILLNNMLSSLILLQRWEFVPACFSYITSDKFLCLLPAKKKQIP